MMRRCAVFGVVLGAVSGCGPADLVAPADLASQQLVITKSSPRQGDTMARTAVIRLSFSRALQQASLLSGAVMIYTGLPESVGAEEVWAQWQAAQPSAVPLTLKVDAAGRELQISSEDEWPGGRLALLLTPDLHSDAGMSIIQGPGRGARPVVLFYTVTVADGAPTPGDGEVVQASQPISETAVALPDAELPITSSADAASPIIETPATPRPTFLRINELLYDVPGPDTNGELFIELRGTPASTLADYQLVFRNGSNGEVTETITLPEGSRMPIDGLFVIADALTGSPAATGVAHADYIENFDPQNGPDAVQLLDPDGTLLDVLGYGMPLPLRDIDGQPLYEGEPAVDVSAGVSLSRDAQGADADHNLLDFFVNIAPSPGQTDFTVEALADPGVSP
jgi:hypothetical protein